jgi:hypothetical protein
VTSRRKSKQGSLYKCLKIRLHRKNLYREI